MSIIDLVAILFIYPEVVSSSLANIIKNFRSWNMLRICYVK